MSYTEYTSKKRKRFNQHSYLKIGRALYLKSGRRELSINDGLKGFLSLTG